MSNFSSIEELSDGILLALACYSLGGAKKKFNSEDIMAKAFEWDKNRFSWILPKYNKFPDNEKLRKALFAARTKKLVIGAYSRSQVLKDGWMLTKAGIETCQTLEHLIHIKKSKKSLKVEDKKILRIFKSHANYKKIYNDEFSIFNLAELIGVSANNMPLLRLRLEKISQLALIGNDHELLESISSIKNNPNFKNLFNEDDYINEHKIKSRSKKNL